MHKESDVGDITILRLTSKKGKTAWQWGLV
jgi:hypothetical protein